jgi:hypothetical protein
VALMASATPPRALHPFPGHVARDSPPDRPTPLRSRVVPTLALPSASGARLLEALTVVLAFAVGWYATEFGKVETWGMPTGTLDSNLLAGDYLDGSGGSGGSHGGGSDLDSDSKETLHGKFGGNTSSVSNLWPPGFPRVLPRDTRNPPSRTRGCITTDAFGEACYFRDAMVCVGFGDALRVGLVVPEGDPLLDSPVLVNRHLPGFRQGGMDYRYFQHAPVPPFGYSAGLPNGSRPHLGTDPEKRWPDTVSACATAFRKAPQFNFGRELRSYSVVVGVVGVRRWAVVPLCELEGAVYSVAQSSYFIDT